MIIALIVVCLLFGATEAFACRYSGTSPIAINGYMARGYGQVSFLFWLGTIYCHVRRAGLTRSTWFWVASFPLIYFLNPGWHYHRLSGDCGIGEAGEAHQMVFYLGAMLLWQIGAGLWFIWHRYRNRAATPSSQCPLNQVEKLHQ